MKKVFSPENVSSQINGLKDPKYLSFLCASFILIKEFSKMFAETVFYAIYRVSHEDKHRGHPLRYKPA